MSLALAFFSDEVNMIVRSLYVCMYLYFTSLRTGRFNWLSEVTVVVGANCRFPTVRKLGMDCFFFEISGKDCGK